MREHASNDASFFGGGFGLAINGGYLYITYASVNSNNVFKCLLATLSTTVPSPCQLTGADKLNAPIDLALSNGYAYITNTGNGNTGKAVKRCELDAFTGDLGSCEESLNFQVRNPGGIVFPPQT